jgi:hypothetical protein
MAEPTSEQPSAAQTRSLRLSRLEAQLDQYIQNNATARRLEIMMAISRAQVVSVDDDNIALLHHRISVSFLRQYAATSRSAAILYEAALHREIGLREFALGHEEPAVKNYAASMLLDLNVFLTEHMIPFGSIFESYMARHSDDTDANVVAGYWIFVTAHTVKDYVGALAYFRKLGDGHPTFPALRSMIHHRLNQKREAIAEDTLALRLGDAIQSPQTNHLHFTRGLLRSQTGDKIGAVADLEKCISLCQGDEDFLSEAYFHLAQWAFCPSRSLCEVRKWYDLGIKAERARSPVFAHNPMLSQKTQLAALLGKGSCYSCAMFGCRGYASLKCSRCLSVRYCGLDCQRAHWNAGHKAVCVKVSAAKPSE